MNNKIKLIATAALCLSGMTSCLQEYEPTEYATQTQVEAADKSTLSFGIASYMTYYGTTLYSDVGFMGMFLHRDVMTADLPIYKTGYDYFWWFPTQTYLGNYFYSTIYWQRYYALINNANNVIGVCSEDREGDLPYLGNALCYRAWAYLDIARMYEYQDTGTAKDAEAKEKGIYGLTGVIVTEKTTEEMGRRNPRVPYWHMYRFILGDLERAQEVLKEVVVAQDKTNGSRSVAYGLAARLWLEIATRCERFPENLAEIVNHDNDADLADYPKIGITSAQDAYANAAKYARLAIDCGYTPISETQWFDPKNGFNSPNNAWMWCITTSAGSDLAVNLTWQSFPSFMSPEVDYGVAQSYYGATRMCDAALYSTIEDTDWRKPTWIDPEDAGKEEAFNTKYARGTVLPYSEWKDYTAYSGFKYHPNQGERSDYTIANCISYPLMRVEEMYFIEAEAVGHVQGAGAGAALLSNFVNNYRTKGGVYSFNAADTDALDREIFRQRRIEFWGEGILLWEYNRHGYAVERGYEGTNHVEEYRFNSYETKKAPWSIIYIPESENARNPEVKLNLNMSSAIPTLWKK